MSRQTLPQVIPDRWPSKMHRQRAFRSLCIGPVLLSTVTIIALIAASPSVGSAQEMFVGYASFCGLPIVVGADPQTASARLDGNGRPFLHIDPGAMGNWTISRVFTIAHECGHHKLGHTTQLGAYQRYMGGTRQQELEADCWAAAALRETGQWADISRTAIERAAQGHFSPGGGYPSGAERAAAIAQCSGIPHCRTMTTPCTHQLHPLGDAMPCQHIGPAHRFDAVPCMHYCMYGPCHPYGDSVPCSHPVAIHRVDTIPCTHAAHPMGDVRQVCD